MHGCGLLGILKFDELSVLIDISLFEINENAQYVIVILQYN